MAKPTSASFRAGASLMPSPVMPTTRPACWARRTRRLLSVGSARATTRSWGISSCICWSVMAESSPEVSICPPPRSRPAFWAMARAVSGLSPVTITTWTPAFWILRTAAAASGRRLSRMRAKPSSTRPPCSSGLPAQTHTTRIPWAACCCQARCRRPASSSGSLPPGDSQLPHRGSKSSGAPLI